MILDLAKFVGVPFKDGGRDYKGCDCWGLAKLIYKDRFGIILPEYGIACDDKSRIDAKITEQKVMWNRRDRKEAGEIPIPSLVVMKFNSHVFCNHIGVYIGNHEFIHTSRGINSHITSIDNPAWSRKIEGFYTLKEEFKCEETFK